LVEYKRFSIVHWTLATVACATWWGLWCGLRRRHSALDIKTRVITLCLGGIVPLAVTATLFPDFFKGPLVEFDPKIMGPWLTTISEFQPMWPDSPAHLKLLAYHLSPAAIGIGFLAYDIARGNPTRRLPNAILAIAAIVYLPLAIATVRWVIYLQILSLIPWALAAAQAIRWTGAVWVRGVRIPLRSILVVALIAAPVLVAATATSLLNGTKGAAKTCDWGDMWAHLTKIHHRQQGDPILMTYLFRGPELVWRTPYRVVGAPYGNAASIGDTITILRADSDEIARGPIERRGIDAILLCRHETENRLYRQEGKSSFLSRLLSGQVPEWLRQEPLPDSLAEDFLLFRVVRP
jgi:hypothetical protein